MPRTLRIAAILVALIAIHLSEQASATITVSGDTTLSSFEIQAGINSIGTLRIDGGSTYTSGGLRLGYQPNGFGTATVTGAGSQLTINQTSFSEIGSAGYGRLDILDGALVHFSSSGVHLRIGAQGSSSSYGEVNVDGPGSILSINNDVTVGYSTMGVMRIRNGAIVNATMGDTNVTQHSRIELDGGVLRTSSLGNTGLIRGNGEIMVSNFSSGDGRFEAGPGQLLRISGAPTGNYNNNGILAVDGGELEFLRNVTNLTSGPDAAEITLRNGIMRLGTPLSGSPTNLTNSGVLAALGGTNDFYGRVSNVSDGRIAVTNNSTMIFHDDVSADSGTIVVFPGSSAVFLEDLTMTGSSVLLADLAGTDDDTGFGQIEVVGNAQLNTSLNISLAGGFTPEAGDEFPILAASTISGGLALGDVPALPSGLKWDIEQEANRVVLSVVPGLAGDYNNDGLVDGADYVVWAKQSGLSGDDLAADGDSSGTVDDDDLAFMSKYFGNTLESGGGAAANGSIPEPVSLAPIFLGLLLVQCGRWRLNWKAR
jgi:T5SS/PEP-CTERM-associated repeat protein